MSKPQKLKKKGMSPRTKEILGTTFKSIISNQACVDGAKNTPWWIAAIFLTLAVFLPLIPIMVSASNTYGASFISGNTYYTDRGLHQTLSQVQSSSYVISIDKGLLSYSDPVFETTDRTYQDVYEGGYNFQLILTNKTGRELNQVIKDARTKYTVGTTNLYDKDTAAETDKPYIPSFLVLARKTMYMEIYKANSTSKVAYSPAGLNWAHYKTDDLATKLLCDDASLAIYTQFTKTLGNFKKMVNNAFQDQKHKTFWTSTGIYFGVYAGLVLFLGLMVFILTRGKKNSFNYLSFFTCQKIAWWASFTPGLLGMILAFIISGNMIGQMGFVLLVSIRVMWLSMRQLRPIQ